MLSANLVRFLGSAGSTAGARNLAGRSVLTPWWRVGARVLLALLVLRANPAQSQERGALLPLQDRLGDPLLNVAIQETLREELLQRHALVDRVELRDSLRRLRLRDANEASPATLRQLADDVVAGWFFTATLHTATETELTRAAEAFVGPGATPVPQIVLSARVYRKISTESSELYLEWAGFASASGLDQRRLLNRGIVEDPEILARRTARLLVAAFEEKPSVDAPRPDRGGFLRGGISVERMGSIAVVPFEGVTDREANVASETVTSLALSVLHENGVRLVPPGLVNQILRRGGTLLRGEVDAETRVVLQKAGVDLILTGTVLAWEVHSRGPEPEPRVSFGARLIDAGSGQILWMNGLDREGWDGLHLFGTGRTYSRGRLAQHMMRSLVAGFLEPGTQHGR